MKIIYKVNCFSKLNFIIRISNFRFNICLRVLIKSKPTFFKGFLKFLRSNFFFELLFLIKAIFWNFKHFYFRRLLETKIKRRLIRIYDNLMISLVSFLRHLWWLIYSKRFSRSFTFFFLIVFRIHKSLLI